LKLRYDDQEREIKVVSSGDVLQAGDLLARVVAGDEDEGTLEIHGRIVPYAAARTKDGVAVWIAGRVWHLQAATGKKRETAGAVSDEILAPMPGTILKMQAQPGDVVTEKQPLVVMESMKMELTLAAPRAGTVASIGGRTGDLVEMGAVLVRLEPQ